MSILQEYAEIKRMIGDKRWEAIKDFLNEVTTEENYQQYRADIHKIIFLPITDVEFTKIDARLKEKYNIILLSDVLYTEKGADAFEVWYKENKKG